MITILRLCLELILHIHFFLVCWHGQVGRAVKAVDSKNLIYWVRPQRFESATCRIFFFSFFLSFSFLPSHRFYRQPILSGSLARVHQQLVECLERAETPRVTDVVFAGYCSLARENIPVDGRHRCARRP